VLVVPATAELKESVAIRVLVSDASPLFADALVGALRCLVPAAVVSHAAFPHADDRFADADAIPLLALIDADRGPEHVLSEVLELRTGNCEVAVLLLARSVTGQHERLARQVSALGVLSRQADISSLETIIRTVAAGRPPCGVPGLIGSDATDAPATTLTDRELDILHLVNAGLANHGIADNLGISANTVRTHVQNILAKLDVPNRLAASALAREIGLLDDPSALAVAASGARSAT
jgi:DNA-binding NarL/FixJ family response regulator